MIKTIKQKIKDYFEPPKPEPVPEAPDRKRMLKDLLRENLGLLSVDMFYIDDPLLGVPPDKRVDYLKKFHEIAKDRDVMERFKYLINKQARTMLQAPMKEGYDPDNDALSGVNINGMASIKDDFDRLGNAYLQESAPVEPFNKFKII